MDLCNSRDANLLLYDDSSRRFALVREGWDVALTRHRDDVGTAAINSSSAASSLSTHRPTSVSSASLRPASIDVSSSWMSRSRKSSHRLCAATPASSSSFTNAQGRK